MKNHVKNNNNNENNNNNNNNNNNTSDEEAAAASNMIHLAASPPRRTPQRRIQNNLPSEMDLAQDLLLLRSAGSQSMNFDFINGDSQEFVTPGRKRRKLSPPMASLPTPIPFNHMNMNSNNEHERGIRSVFSEMTEEEDELVDDSSVKLNADSVEEISGKDENNDANLKNNERSGDKGNTLSIREDSKHKQQYSISVQTPSIVKSAASTTTTNFLVSPQTLFASTPSSAIFKNNNKNYNDDNNNKQSYTFGSALMTTQLKSINSRLKSSPIHPFLPSPIHMNNNNNSSNKSYNGSHHQKGNNNKVIHPSKEMMSKLSVTPMRSIVQLSNNNQQSENDDKSNQKKDEKETQTCNCTKSQCLKLYCQCFAKLMFCGPNCNCNDCLNLEGGELVAFVIYFVKIES